MPSDVFQWKNSAHKTASIGANSKFATTNRDYDEAIDRTHDQLEQLFEPSVRTDCLTDVVCMYNTHFDQQISIKHREHLRDLTDALYDRALNLLFNKYKNNEQEIVQQERDKLADQLDELRTELNWVAGSTRNCFAMGTIAHTMHHNSVYMSSLLAKMRSDAITSETQALHDAIDRKHRSYLEGDQLDYNKYIAALEMLKGAWHKTDFTDNTDRTIDETVTEVTFVLQFNRTAGSIGDTSGIYDGDIADIISAGSGALAP